MSPTSACTLKERSGRPLSEWTCRCGRGYWDAGLQECIEGGRVERGEVQDKAAYDAHVRQCADCRAQAEEDDRNSLLPGKVTRSVAQQCPRVRRAKASRKIYFLPGEGIDQRILERSITGILGSDALVKPVTRSDGRYGFEITASTSLTSAMIAELRSGSVQVNQSISRRDSRDETQYPRTSSDAARYDPTRPPDVRGPADTSRGYPRNIGGYSHTAAVLARPEAYPTYSRDEDTWTLFDRDSSDSPGRTQHTEEGSDSRTRESPTERRNTELERVDSMRDRQSSAPSQGILREDQRKPMNSRRPSYHDTTAVVARRDSTVVRRESRQDSTATRYQLHTQRIVEGGKQGGAKQEGQYADRSTVNAPRISGHDSYRTDSIRDAPRSSSYSSTNEGVSAHGRHDPDSGRDIQRQSEIRREKESRSVYDASNMDKAMDRLQIGGSSPPLTRKDAERIVARLLRDRGAPEVNAKQFANLVDEYMKRHRGGER